MSVQDVVHEFQSKSNGPQISFCKIKGLDAAWKWRLAQT